MNNIPQTIEKKVIDEAVEKGLFNNTDSVKVKIKREIIKKYIKKFFSLFINLSKKIKNTVKKNEQSVSIKIADKDRLIELAGIKNIGLKKVDISKKNECIFTISGKNDIEKDISIKVRIKGQ
jgi:hypothetical protein